MKTAGRIVMESVLVLFMIGLVPLITDDYILTGVYVLLIAGSLLVKRNPGDLLVFGVGFVVMLATEYFFVSTGAEIFTRNSLFGVMPLWLPLLWGYAFIAMRRGLKAL
ncbi:MAG: hypothetical protein AAB923_00935, partial [Patescibacteria group bacterium]